MCSRTTMLRSGGSEMKKKTTEFRNESGLGERNSSPLSVR
ncbi:Protein CBG26005 [Caenorhabditis briggsae]|uniref:Protein CBG26005 n=1 Tax=Caenorhabditis briggsae TaxID=6238 RepID=B6IKV5_CAEBR|nr:Protein CBG26005 [Caenorhabditis briggsae]CAS00535.1 Protein CBG26005 [Caenorhabditis briggsae]